MGLIEEFESLVAAESAEPEMAMARVRRWVDALSGAEAVLGALAGFGPGRTALVKLFAHSRAWSDALTQNPELGVMLADPDAGLKWPEVDSARDAGLGLAGQSVSYSHSLDRLRYLKQKGVLRCLALDLIEAEPPYRVWRGLSDLAEGLLQAAAEIVWREVRERMGLGETPLPVWVLAFGKMGGWELNLSSDVDLVYVMPDAVDAEMEGAVTRWAEMFGKAVSDRMGRGALYRVDTRLRPFGRSGPLVPRQKSVERYYRDYAEPWEQLAMIRSRVIAGDGAAWWAELRGRTVFRTRTKSEGAVADLLRMRERLEALGGESDLKRGPGGIRDVEFAVQIWQWLRGVDPDQRELGATTGAIRALAEGEAGFAELGGGQLEPEYGFLRQVEHRLQMRDDTQTHALPKEAQEWAGLGRAMGFGDGAEFEKEMRRVRAHVRELYLSLTGATVAVSLGSVGWDEETEAAVGPWLDGHPDGDGLRALARESEDVRTRLAWLGRTSPRLVAELRAWSVGGGPGVGVTERVVSGEIAEASQAGSERSGWLSALARASLGIGEFSAEWTAEVERWVGGIAAETGVDVCALGSFSAGTMGPGSDADILIWGGDETRARAFLGRLQERRQAGSPITVDVRLRPEGRNGALSVSAAALEKYAATRLEDWERVALLRARPVTECAGLGAALEEWVFGSGVRVDFEGLVRMKRRLEVERAPVPYQNRHVKHSPGGLDDAEWASALVMLAHPLARLSGQGRGLREGLLGIAEVGIVSYLEAYRAADAAEWMLRLRTALWLSGAEGDVVPESPDKLGRVAELLEMEDGNRVLNTWSEGRGALRGVYERVMEAVR